MTKRKLLPIYLFPMLGIFLLFSNGCKKDTPPDPVDNGPIKFNKLKTYGTVTDIEGNVYKTIEIGSQTWMAENLRTTKYNDGTSIPMVSSFDSWKTLTSGAYCNYNNTSNEDSIAIFGRLYNFYSIETGKLAPAGWHVPSFDDWKFNLDGIDPKELKEEGLTHWPSSKVPGTNLTGFTALPSGWRTSNDFEDMGYGGLYWTSTEWVGYSEGWTRHLWSNYFYLTSDDQFKWNGLSVRCLKDK